MVEFTNKESLILAIKTQRDSSRTPLRLGFVPTMGALHQGHISLVELALAENDLVVVSIFVNPTQFNNADDLDKYPRTPERDLELLKKTNGNIFIYRPAVEDIYDTEVASVHYDFDGLEYEMEGEHREGHFDGVGTIVSKLFKIITPDRAYFGEKDFQQLQIIRKLVALDNLPVEIIGCPIIRESNGLAMSSRNKRLSPEELEKASFIYKTLMEVKDNFDSHSLTYLYDLVSERFLNNPHLELEYFTIANENTLKAMNEKTTAIPYRAFIAAFIGGVRLIDNIALN